MSSAELRRSSHSAPLDRIVRNFLSFLLLSAWSHAPVAGAVDKPEPGTVLPVPAGYRAGIGRLAVTSTFAVALPGHDDARLRQGIVRALIRAEERTGLPLAHDPTGGFALSGDVGSARLVINCTGPGSAVPRLGDDESYTLSINPTQAVLQAPAVVGALRGLETLLQLLQADASGWFLPAVEIRDEPRFPWRGLMIDVSRHWQPLAVLKRNLDGMALVKLNVLHLHLTDDQGFRIESRKFPRLHEAGSDGLYFTQDDMRDLIAYATARGIRVVPEFDVPGHATSWLAAYPELASGPGPYPIERRWGVFNPVLDPTNPRVYELLDGFLGEMAALFPDAYMHIGGDENNGVQWNANPRIRAFILAHHLRDNAGLHAYFNAQVHAILVRYGKRMIGWDEILHPDLAPDSVIHSWRGPDGMAAATAAGHPAVLSNGYYIDLGQPTSAHYLNDPIPPNPTLTAAQQKLVLGGEATMWSEWVTPATIDSRIWPRTAAIAERLWSPAAVRDIPDMYRRVALVGRRLEEAGLRHESYLEPALRRLAGDQASATELAALRVLVDAVEPVKNYARGSEQPEARQFTPLTGLVDCARPDSTPAREFAAAVEGLVIASAAGPADSAALRRTFDEWRAAAATLAGGFAQHSPRGQAAAPVIEALATAGQVGGEALTYLASCCPPPDDWPAGQRAALARAALPHAAVELPEIASLRLLVAAVTAQGSPELADPAWRERMRQNPTAPVAGAAPPQK